MLSPLNPRIFNMRMRNMAAPMKQEYLLQFFYHPDGKESPGYQNVLKRYCRQYNVINVKSIEEHDILELSYYVRFKDKENSNQFIQNLPTIDGVRDINLFFDQEDF